MYETASIGPGATRRSKPRKRSDLRNAVSKHLAAISRKGTATPLDKLTLDSATDQVIADARAKAKARKK